MHKYSIQNRNLKSGSHLPKKLFSQEKPFKNDEKFLIFYLKSYFRYQHIYIFVLTFWSCRKNGLIKKIRLISIQIIQISIQITIQILPKISQNKSNQAMKFAQIIEDNKRSIFLKKSCIKWAAKTSSRPLSVF